MFIAMKHAFATRHRFAAAVSAALIAVSAFDASTAWSAGGEQDDDPAGLAPPTFTLPDDPPTHLDGGPKADVPPGLAPHGPNPKAEAASPERKAPSTPEQRETLLAELYDRLAVEQDEAIAAPIAEAIQHLWNVSGSPTADLLVQRAVALAQSNRQDLALELLTTAIELQPDYAEAWNRRAYLFYLMNDTERALGDIRRVLALDPKHYKALDGLASILQNAGDKKNALKAYESLLEVYPAMPGAKTARDELLRAVEGQGI